MRGTTLRDQWARALQRLPKIHKFTAGMRNSDNTGVQENIYPFDDQPTPCTIEPKHPHDDVHTYWRCMQVMAPIGDAVYFNAQSALQAIPAQVKSFAVQHAMTPTAVNAFVADREFMYTTNVLELKFEGMAKLKYRPTVMGGSIVPPHYQGENDQIELAVDMEQAVNLSRLLHVSRV